MNLSSYFIFNSIDMLYVYYELINDVYITYNMYLTYVISNIIMYNYYHTLLYDIILWYLSYIIYYNTILYINIYNISYLNNNITYHGV